MAQLSTRGQRKTKSSPNLQSAETVNVSTKTAKKRQKKASGLSDRLKRAAALSCLLIVFARVDILTAFGTGTGYNKCHINPISVTAHYIYNEAPLKQFDGRFDLASRKIWASFAVPGELWNGLFLKTEKNTDKKQNKKKNKKETDSSQDIPVYVRATNWAKQNASDKGLTRIVSNNYVLIGGAFVALFGVLLGLFLAEEGIITFIGGLMAMWVGANNGSANVQLSWYVYYVIMPIVFFTAVIEPYFFKNKEE